MTDEVLVRPLPDAPAIRPSRPIALDEPAAIQAFLVRPVRHDHVVQFYEDDRTLVDNIVRFAATGLRCGEPVVVIATARRRDTIAVRMMQQDLDVDGACATGQLVMLDAADVLATFMDGDRPSWDRFRHTVGSILENSGRGGACIRAYGEMVDLLWRAGNRAAAIELEGFWNDLSQLHSFSLMCAYAMGNFFRATDAAQFDQICRTHSHVIPHDDSSSDPEDRGRELLVLRQRARALEAEISHRTDLERALREALARAQAARLEAEHHVRASEMFADLLGQDLRVPLGKIAMLASSLARANLGDKPARDAIRTAARAERMSRMVDQLLDFTRLRIGGGLELDRTWADLTELCHRVREELAGTGPITVDSAGYTAGAWDLQRLLQVLSSVVSHAIAHDPTSRGVRVAIDGSAAGEVAIRVHHEGALAAELAASLFEPFHGDPRHSRANGLGLGLFVSKQIVLAHHGTISLESSAVHGTTVHITLPRLPPRDGAQGP